MGDDEPAHATSQLVVALDQHVHLQDIMAHYALGDEELSCLEYCTLLFYRVKLGNFFPLSVSLSMM